MKHQNKSGSKKTKKGSVATPPSLSTLQHMVLKLVKKRKSIVAAGNPVPGEIDELILETTAILAKREARNKS